MTTTTRRSSLHRIARIVSALALGAALLVASREARADDTTTPGASATAADDPMNNGPKAGAFTLDLRPVAVGAIETPSSTELEMTGLQLGAGKRVSRNWYLGGSGEFGVLMNLPHGDSGAGTSMLLRGGPEARYVFGQSTAQVSTNGDAGPWSPVPFIHWVGARAGAQSLDSGASFEPFAEVEYGGDAWLSNSFQFGVGAAAGASVLPGASKPEPYGTLTFRLGFDVAG